MTLSAAGESVLGPGAIERAAAADALCAPPPRTVISAQSRTPSAAAAVGEGTRLAFIDGLRGLAALAVMLMHFFHPDVSPLHAALAEILARPVQWMLLRGELGVQIFFVLSGFVIAYTLREKQVSVGYAVNFMLRRSIRLDPPYWTMIALLVGSQYLVWHEYGVWEVLRWWGGVRNIVLNLFYLQDLVHEGNVFGIVSVGWTLCLEVQFYLALITLLTLGGWARRRWGGRAESAALALVVLPLTAYSFYIWFRVPRYDFAGMWFMFFAGVALWWTLSGRMRLRWLALLLAVIATGGVWRSDGPAIAVAVTVVAIFAAARGGGMSRWLADPVMQHLGRISYSLYLSHLTIGLLAIALVWDLSAKTVPAAVFAYALGCAAAVGFAHLLHRLVEAPFIRLARRLKPAGQPVPT